MKKSFKKVMACLLAVIMATFSMPFSALAAVGDYTPDIQLQFSTFCDDPCDPTNKTAKSATDYQASGLAGFPIIWDQENGTLTATKEDFSVYNEYWEEDPVDEDWVLGEGDIFAVTVRLDNTAIASAGNIRIRFSDNLTPAGLYQNKKAYGYASEENIPSGATKLVGFRSAVTDWSATKLYGDGKVFNTAMDQNAIQADPAAVADDGWSDDLIRANFVGNGDYVDVSSVGAENGFFDITNGTYDADNGYTYNNQFIVATFVFQITNDGPVKFALQDPDGSIDPDLDGAAFYANKSEGLQTKYATTYAVNTVDSETENPGSRKMTFMGKNDNGVTVTFKAENGDVISSKEYGKGMAVEVPALPETVVADDTHTTYAWDSEVSETAVENATYQVVATTANHNFVNPQVTKHATCTEKGEMVSTCECGKTKTEEIAMTDHTPGEAVRKNEVAPTCEQEGSYDLVVSCTVCKTELESEHKTIEKLPHTEGTAVKENEVLPTCTEGGSYDEVVYCTKCNAEMSRESKTTDALEHSYTAEVTAPTCTEGGYTTYTCTRCKDTYVADFVDKLDHDYVAVVTKPTCTKGGYTTHTCSRCQDTYTDSETNALGHKWDAGKVTKKATPTATGIKTYTCTVCGATKKETIPKCAKYANPMVVKTKTASLKYSNLKKKNLTVAKTSAFTITKAQGKVTFKKSSGNSKITISSAGKFTVKKGLKKGTYKVKVKVTAAGNASYKAVTKTVTVTIKVK